MKYVIDHDKILIICQRNFKKCIIENKKTALKYFVIFFTDKIKMERKSA